MNHATVLLLNTTGQVVSLKENVSGNQYSLDLSGFASGIYFIKVVSENKIFSTQKIVKQ